MSAISTILARLRAAIWAIDVRDDIANAIEQCYSDVSNPTLKTEALEAALQNKIDQGKMAALTIGDGTLTGAKLADGTIPKAKLDPSITFDADSALDTTSTNAIQNKIVAENFRDIKADLDALEPGLSNDARLALLDCLDHLMWEGGSGQGYIDTLREALNVQPVPDNPFEGAEYEIGAFGYNQASDRSSGIVTKNDTLTTRVRTTAPVSCTHGRVIAKTGYEINLYMLNSQSYGEWSSSITGYNDLAYIGTSYYQWGTEKEILTGTRYCLLVVRKTSGDSFTQEEAENIYDTGFVYEEV